MYVFLQYFDTVGWVFWPVKIVARITYTVLVETLNHAQSINQSINQSLAVVSKLLSSNAMASMSIAKFDY